MRVTSAMQSVKVRIIWESGWLLYIGWPQKDFSRRPNLVLDTSKCPVNILWQINQVVWAEIEWQEGASHGMTVAPQKWFLTPFLERQEH